MNTCVCNGTVSLCCVHLDESTWLLLCTTLQGENVKSRVSDLLETLENCDLNSILAFFEAS